MNVNATVNIGLVRELYFSDVTTNEPSIGCSSTVFVMRHTCYSSHMHK